MYKVFIRPILFLINPEAVHNLVYAGIRILQEWKWFQDWVAGIYNFEDKSLEKSIMGLKFKNPVGIAAGFDKDGMIVDGLAGFGFGFIEIGTLTPLPQPGNLKPRLFRLRKDKALINRMGFNNLGVEHAVKILKKRRTGIVVGGNIGKNKITPNQNAIGDYLACFKNLFDFVDYFVVNVSSPNTPGLRELQEKEPLKKLLIALMEENKRMGGKPLLLKIAPDLTRDQLNDIVDIVIETGLAGIVASNTTITRNNILTDPEKIKDIGEGGLSGKPLLEKTVEIVGYLRNKLGKNYVIIGVGGIMSPEDACRIIQSGADLIQVYTGFIYEGPSIAKQINQTLSDLMK